MIHPKLTSLGGREQFLAEIGPTGAWGDLSWITRWGDGACGMFEATWTMPLPQGFDHPLLRRGTMVELMDGSLRIGSPLIMSEPARGTGYDNPWTITCEGIGREVEGENSFYALDGSGDTTTLGITAVDAAIASGWRIAGRDATIPAGGPSASATSDELRTVGALLGLIAAESGGKRWGVGDDNLVRLLSDPGAPTWQVIPGASSMGVADDDYATVVLFRYLDDVTHTFETAVAPSAPSAVELYAGHREFPVDRTDLGEIPAAVAQALADGILARSKGRLGWTNGLTVTSQELQTIGGVPAVDLSMVQAGQMVRLHGVLDDLLDFNGQTWLDIVIGETRYTDGASTVQINPLGLAARNLADVVEAVSGKTAA